MQLSIYNIHSQLSEVYSVTQYFTRVGHGLDSSMDWIGLDWIGWDWIGSFLVEKIGLDWIGLDWVRSLL